MLFVFCVVSLGAYPKDPDSGLVFNDQKFNWETLSVSGKASELKRALLVAPDDIPDRGHFSNSSMARVELLEISPGEALPPYTVSEDAREQIFIVLAGKVECQAGGQRLVASLHDIIFVPPGVSRSLVAVGDGNARVLRADWQSKGTLAEDGGQAFIVSEKLRPVEPTNGEGYVSVVPNARQQGNALSIVSFGAGHIKSSNSLLLYPLDIDSGRPFRANTLIARMGLSQYAAEGGTRWHFHADREQCLVVLSGKGLVEIGANTIEAKEGDIIFAPRHVGHGYKTIGDEPFKFLELEWGRM